MYLILGMVVLASLIYPPISEGQGGYDFLIKWGMKGHGDGKFMYSRDVAVGRFGNIYVTDAYNNRVQKFTSDGVFLNAWGAKGDTNGQFNCPCSITADGSGNIYVADTYNNRIQKFTSGGDFLAKWGAKGNTNGEFDKPFGLAVDGSGHVYVADTYNHRVQKFTSDGVFLTKWGAEGSDNGQFNYPHGIAVDGSRNVYVVDKDNDRVQKFTSDGVLLTRWGTAGDGDAEFDRPVGVAVDSSANVYIADTGNNRIQKFSPDGDLLTKWGAKGDDDGLFSRPFGIAVDGSGNVYIADTCNHRIQKFIFDRSITIPVADFSAQPESGKPTLMVKFTDLSENNPANWIWNFGSADGSISTIQNPTHAYTKPGYYTVKLKVTNPAGVDIEVKADYIHVTQKEVTVGQLVQDVAKEYNVELQLLLALIKVESNFKSDAVSKAGAAGLMQLTPDTARNLGMKVPRYRDGTRPNHDPNVDERFDPVKSLRNGAKYLRDMLDKYDSNYILAIAAYNAGPGEVSKNVPLIRETERHANKVLNYYFRYKNSQETQTEALQILERMIISGED